MLGPMLAITIWLINPRKIPTRPPGWSGRTNHSPGRNLTRLGRALVSSPACFSVLKYNTIYIYIIQNLYVCVCLSVTYRRPNGWTNHDQIWHVYAERSGIGSYIKNLSHVTFWTIRHVWSGRVGSLGPLFEAGT